MLYGSELVLYIFHSYQGNIQHNKYVYNLFLRITFTLYGTVYTNYGEETIYSELVQTLSDVNAAILLYLRVTNIVRLNKYTIVYFLYR